MYSLDQLKYARLQKTLRCWLDWYWKVAGEFYRLQIAPCYETGIGSAELELYSWVFIRQDYALHSLIEFDTGKKKCGFPDTRVMHSFSFRYLVLAAFLLVLICRPCNFSGSMWLDFESREDDFPGNNSNDSENTNLVSFCHPYPLS